ncbi:MAG: oligosaccharide flippase family protein, partial [Pseudomonadota bacterium]
MTAQARRIARNTVASTLGHGLGQLSTLLFLVIFARVHGADVLGEFWFAMAAGAMLAIVIARGVNSLLSRAIARAPERGSRLVGAESAAQFGIAAAVLALLPVAAGWLTGNDRAAAIFVIVGAYQIIYAAANVYRVYFNAREAMHVAAALEVGHKLTILVAGSLALYLAAEPSTVLLAYPAAALLFVVAGFALIARH